MHVARGESRNACEVAEQLLGRAQRLSDRSTLLRAESALGVTSFYMGELLLARKHLEIAISIYEPERHRRRASQVGINCVSHAAWTLWQLGYPDQALTRGNEAVALAQGLSRTLGLAHAGLFVGVLRQHRREARAAQENAESVIALSAEHGLTDYWAWATSLHAWAMAEQGRSEEGVAHLQEGLAALRATRSEMLRPYFLCMLAEAYMEAGRFDDGLSALTDALAAADEHENRSHEAEIHRLKGELLLRQNHSNAATALSCFQRVSEIARKQSAKSWELRATMSLARLLAKSNRREEGRKALAEIYGWFTEGFDTADLKEAKALLDELNA